MHVEDAAYVSKEQLWIWRLSGLRAQFFSVAAMAAADEVAEADPRRCSLWFRFMKTLLHLQPDGCRRYPEEMPKRESGL